MGTLKKIEKEKQMIARSEKSLALDKLKKRRADTRRKIELGGLVIKSGMNVYKNTVILGGLAYLIDLIKKDENFISSITILGDDLFNL
ncbi:conjugal transfer protein TraD [Legionella micdadei]|uniref:conjugal transfer protein TraD n=1 Tax=Legionella micdadei TaxID=451 RepID=UPI003A800A7D